MMEMEGLMMGCRFKEGDKVEVIDLGLSGKVADVIGVLDGTQYVVEISGWYGQLWARCDEENLRRLVVN